MRTCLFLSFAFILLVVFPPAGLALLAIAFFGALASKPSDKKAQRLPNCPNCGWQGGWNVHSKSVGHYQAWTPGIYTFLNVQCPNCGLRARLRYNDPGFGNVGHKGWMFS